MAIRIFRARSARSAVTTTSRLKRITHATTDRQDRTDNWTDHRNAGTSRTRSRPARSGKGARLRAVERSLVVPYALQQPDNHAIRRLSPAVRSGGNRWAADEPEGEDASELAGR